MGMNEFLHSRIVANLVEVSRSIRETVPRVKLYQMVGDCSPAAQKCWDVTHKREYPACSGS
jgi:hypothetical protein